MAEIRVLDKHTAELIAAGEVVERPASVAKELLENAIDAGATQITLSAVRGGISQLQIVDNGSGIEAEYIDKAFIRHATSKISTAEDLNHIRTLGFRGEALASIASVARVDVLTRTEQDEYACHYRIEGGDPQGMEAGARPVGTTITVSDLFYNTPARMKFLKKDATEGTYVSEAVLHEALAHPEISFRFLRDGKQQFLTPGDGDLRSAVYAVLGREFARDLLAVEGESGVYRVTGLITPPRACRASRGAQHFFVNGRYVKNRTMMAALENAYKGTMMQGKFPGAVLMLEMPADLVDVNVHPAKTEIRFARESDVFDAVYRAVRTALTTPGSGECRFELHESAPAKKEVPLQPAPAAHRPASEKPRFTTLSAAEYRALNRLTEPVAPRPLPGDIHVESPGPRYDAGAASSAAVQRDAVREEAVLDILPDEPDADGAPGQELPAVHYPATAANDLESLADAAGRTLPSALADALSGMQAVPTPPETEAGGILPGPRDTEADGTGREEASQTALSALPAEGDAPEQTVMAPPAAEPLRLVGEVFKTYIITERGAELCLIDKHAAHERILFEKLASAYGNVPAQMLLVPVQVNLTAGEKQALMQNLELLADAGVEVEDFGGPTVLVRAVPADVVVDDVEDMVVELASHLQNGGRDALREKTEWVLHSIACRAAIKAGDRTTSAEMLALAQQIMDGTIPPFCPHGRPCVLKITRKELEKQFGRLV
ncbi:DNA mismatch repair endonuclease MutL [uncultured Subdoligranulum sp.]|uniref:DNA mismatch repair endonuclease MutL n=1 Tax=uncultured Subdoligranulum sp. TaxID=512298 RepID=UPI0026125F19|nr:DNA mismatch repair endonuclease MutL [uncultured Subdoligranulum sp.]